MIVTPPTPSILRGLDVAAPQGAIDYVQLEQWNETAPEDERVFYITAKGVEGNGYKDPYFPANWAGVRHIRLPRGAYGYAHPDLVPNTDAREEAEHLQRTIDHCGGLQEEDLGSVLDIEEASRITKGEPFVRWTVDWLDRTREISGKIPGWYTGGPFFDEHSKGVSEELLLRLQNYWLWLAAYVQDPNKFLPKFWRELGRNQRFWQKRGNTDWTGKAGTGLRVGGIANVVDEDIYVGIVDDLRADIAAMNDRPPTHGLAAAPPSWQPQTSPTTVLPDLFPVVQDGDTSSS